MPKIISCGIAPIRKHNDKIEILLCKPTNSGYYGMGFLKGQMEDGETLIEVAKREFDEESGGLEIEIIDENVFFIQNNPKKKIYIWPSLVTDSIINKIKISIKGEIPEHDIENELIKFYPLDKLPKIFKNQQEIMNQLLDFIETTSIFK